MSEYGLATPRDDETDDPLPVDHTYEWDEEEVTIELVPPTLDQLEEYQDLGGDVDTDRLRDIVDKHITKPDIPAGKMTVREVNCYIRGILDYGEDGGSDRIQQMREALQERNGRGNAES